MKYRTQCERILPGRRRHKNESTPWREKHKIQKGIEENKREARRERSRREHSWGLLESMLRWWHGLLRQLWRRRNVALIRAVTGDEANAKPRRNRQRTERRGSHQSSGNHAPSGSDKRSGNTNGRCASCPNSRKKAARVSFLLFVATYTQSNLPSSLGCMHSSIYPDIPVQPTLPRQTGVRRKAESPK